MITPYKLISYIKDYLFQGLPAEDMISHHDNGPLQTAKKAVTTDLSASIGEIIIRSPSKSCPHGTN